MRVLLISPLDPKVPINLKLLMGGENTFTRILLQLKLKNITFIYFAEALKNKNVTYHWTQNFFLWLQKLRILPPGPRVQALIVKGHFDLVYAHVYPVRLSKSLPPLVISDSSSNEVFLEKYLHWSKWRLKFAHFIKVILYKTFNIIDGEVNTEKAKKFFVFSKWAKKIKNEELKIKNCEVIYPGLPVPDVSRDDNKSPKIKILFVGVWFERKGGRILLEVFRKLRKKYPQIQLTILGQLPSDISIKRNQGIRHQNFVSYKKLRRFYSQQDILVHVPSEIEGYGMAVTEAMSYGMVPVVSRICVLPEFVDHGKSGLLVKTESTLELEKMLARLIKNRRLRKQLSLGAMKKFNSSFSLPVFQKRLTGLFNQALTCQT